MGITIDLTDEELEELKSLTRQGDPAAAVRTAAQEYVRYMLRMSLIELSGRIEMQDNWRELEDAELAENDDQRSPGTHTD